MAKFAKQVAVTGFPAFFGICRIFAQIPGFIPTQVRHSPPPFPQTESPPPPPTAWRHASTNATKCVNTKVPMCKRINVHHCCPLPPPSVACFDGHHFQSALFSTVHAGFGQWVCCISAEPRKLERRLNGLMTCMSMGHHAQIYKANCSDDFPCSFWHSRTVAL